MWGDIRRDTYTHQEENITDTTHTNICDTGYIDILNLAKKEPTKALF